MKAGQLIQDGTVTWIVDDVRDGARVGDIVLRPTLRDGYIKANGATVKASEYPRLLAWAQESGMAVTAEQYAQDCSKYVYDSAQDKLTLPNVTGRVLQGGEQVRSIEAGLPNITGTTQMGFILGNVTGADSWGEGAITVQTIDKSAAYVGGGNVARSTVGINASKSNQIYGHDDTVQPPAIAMIAQIKY